MRKSDKSSPYASGSGGSRSGSKPPHKSAARKPETTRKPDTRNPDAVRKPDAGRGKPAATAESPWQRARPPAARTGADSGEQRTERARREGPPNQRKDNDAGYKGKPRRTERGAEPAPRPRKALVQDRAPAETESQDVDEAKVERKIYGVNAALAFMRERADDIIRGYFTEITARKHFGQLMKDLAQTRRAYHIVENDELQKVTESMHHEGVCLLVRDSSVPRMQEWLLQAPAAAHTVLALEGVANPHNLGAIMRTAAHFGVAAIMTSGAERLRSGAAMRTAEGGAERVVLVEAGSFLDSLVLLQKAGYRIVVTSSHKGASVFEIDWTDKVCVVMGEEQQGVSRQVLALADQCVSIPGTGAVESLNVSVATAIIVAQCVEAQRQRHRPQGTLRKAKPARKS